MINKKNYLNINYKIKKFYIKKKQINKKKEFFFKRINISNQIHNNYNIIKKKKKNVSVAGRMINKRIIGSIAFVKLKDMGGYIQLYITKNKLSNSIYEKKFKKWNLGDILGAKGLLFKTKTGEVSILCSELYILKKTKKVLPEKFNKILDYEIRYRQRYLDLIINNKSNNIFKIRSKIIFYIRNYMNINKFIEVETPMIQTIPGGASAKPFITYHNSLNIKMYLRISPELYLKRLVIGGFERVYEINKNFRNEGISSRHNPEFTMMEVYMAYSNYKILIKFIESLIKNIIKNVIYKKKILYKNYLFNFNKPFKKITMYNSIKKYYYYINIKYIYNIFYLKKFLKSINIKTKKYYKIGNFINKIFEIIIIPKLIQPTFITEYPIEVSPLSKRNSKNPSLADRFELFIGGLEICNGFSELNNVNDQNKRFKEQMKNLNNSNSIIFSDKDYIKALEYGLPPTAGLGLGIDRIIMILTNSNTIKDVILFPVMKKKI
ncbi:MAG: lysine--tRNA ligase [Enterobacteriaceae bacterium PSmelAO3-2]|nr:MAG: lysine--tRNA ligase [Enterobacteriaceae bacterium PSmelAO3-2]WMC17898.1 MAG: lysine--tRNA ligase [Enterobacteriaceae bacterium PSmelAO3-1]